MILNEIISLISGIKRVHTWSILYLKKLLVKRKRHSKPTSEKSGQCLKQHPYQGMLTKAQLLPC